MDGYMHIRPFTSVDCWLILRNDIYIYSYIFYFCVQNIVHTCIVSHLVERSPELKVIMTTNKLKSVIGLKYIIDLNIVAITKLLWC